jgi:hypothetical protein
MCPRRTPKKASTHSKFLHLSMKGKAGVVEYVHSFKTEGEDGQMVDDVKKGGCQFEVGRVEELQLREEDLEVVEVSAGRLFDVGGLEEYFGCSA